MSHSKTEKVIDGLNNSHRGESFQYETDVLKDLQRDSPATFAANRQSINDQVDFRKLGFSEDFKILSVSANNQVMSVNERGDQYQVRDGRTLELQSELPVGSAALTCGDTNGTYVRRLDGSVDYTVKAGDTLWNITRDVLTKNGGGRVPSDTDIDQNYRRIAEANALKNPNSLAVGQHLTIPPLGVDGNIPATMQSLPGYHGIESQKYPAFSEYPGVGPFTATNPNLRPQGKGVFSPIAAAGLPGGDDTYVYDREKTGQENFGGQLRSSYTGWLRDSSLGLNRNNTKFDARDVTDPSGRIINRYIEYSNPIPEFKDVGAQIKFDRGFGAPITLGVRSVATNLDASGNYQSVIRTDDGRTYHSITDARGKTIRFYQS